MKRIARIHYLTQDRITNFPVIQQVELAAELGIKWIQYRVFPSDETSMLRELSIISKICIQNNVRLIVNDDVLLAKRVDDVSGVHIGINDMPFAEARNLLGNDKIIGCSALNTKELIHFAEQGADYISIGPFKPTLTKDISIPAIGIDGLKFYKKFCDERAYNIPLIAAGGILLEDIDSILSIRIHGVAISSVINKAKHPEKIISKFADKQ